MTAVLLTGDINLLNVDDPSTPLHRIADVLNSADAVFANLECMLGAPGSHSVEREGFFADPVIAAKVLKDANIGAVGIANNINYGAGPITASVAVLDEHGIAHAGAGANVTAARQPAIVERNGVRYGFLQRTSVYWPTDHAADDEAAGVVPLMGHTAYEAPMYRYSKWLFPANRPGIPPQIITWANQDHLAWLRVDIEAMEESPHTSSKGSAPAGSAVR